MSWMIKGGSSSALEQSPLHSPHNELALRGRTSTKHEARTPSSVIASTIAGGVQRRRDRVERDAGAAGRRLEREVVYPSEGFG